MLGYISHVHDNSPDALSAPLRYTAPATYRNVNTPFVCVFKYSCQIYITLNHVRRTRRIGEGPFSRKKTIPASCGSAKMVKCVLRVPLVMVRTQFSSAFRPSSRSPAHGSSLSQYCHAMFNQSNPTFKWAYATHCVTMYSLRSLLCQATTKRSWYNLALF